LVTIGKCEVFITIKTPLLEKRLKQTVNYWVTIGKYDVTIGIKALLLTTKIQNNKKFPFSLLLENAKLLESRHIYSKEIKKLKENINYQVLLENV